jgi:hypothetical protein
MAAGTTLRVLSRFRFRLRTLLLLPVAFCVAFVLLSLIDSSQTARWVGSKAVTLRFVVIDAQTKEPIENASLEFIDGDIPQGAPERVLYRDARGSAQLAARCTTSRSVGRLGLLNVAMAQVPPWVLRASKGGYETYGPVPLYKHIDGASVLEKTGPPPLRIELRRRAP